MVSGNHICAQFIQFFANNHFLVRRHNIDSVVIFRVFAQQNQLLSLPSINLFLPCRSYFLLLGIVAMLVNVLKHVLGFFTDHFLHFRIYIHTVS